MKCKGDVGSWTLNRAAAELLTWELFMGEARMEHDALSGFVATVAVNTEQGSQAPEGNALGKK